MLGMQQKSNGIDLSFLKQLPNESLPKVFKTYVEDPQNSCQQLQSHKKDMNPLHVLVSQINEDILVYVYII